MKDKLKYMDEETKNFIIITVLVIMLFSFFLWLTALRLNKPFVIRNPNISYSNEIQYKEIMAGSIFNLEKDKYYVFVLKDNHPYNYLFESTVDQDENIDYYTVRLDNPLNNGYFAEESVKEKNGIKFSGSSVLLVENGELIEFIETREELTEYFSK